MTRRHTDEYVRASDLAQLGTCERLVRYQAVLGRRETAEQVEAVRRGLNAHEAFYRESLAIAAASQRKGKCFVATLTLGTASETAALRAFRDLVLRRSNVGRQLIAAYYRMGPATCSVLQRWPALQVPVRSLVRWLGRCAAAHVDRRMRGPS